MSLPHASSPLGVIRRRADRAPTNPEAAAREKSTPSSSPRAGPSKATRAFNPTATRGIALREVPLESGGRDCLLLVDRVPFGVIEAKKEGTTLSTVSAQSALQGESLPDALAHPPPRQKTEALGLRNHRRRDAVAATLHGSLWSTNAIENVRRNERAGAVFSPRPTGGPTHSRAADKTALPAAVSAKAGGKSASPPVPAPL